jgi:hypothetical protein
MCLYEFTFPPIVDKGYFFPYPHQYLLLFVFLITILTGLRQNLNVVLISTSFINKDFEHFFIYLMSIYMSSFESCLFISFAHFFIGLLILKGIRYLHVKWNKPISERQRSHAFSNMWKIDLINKCIHKYKCTHIYVCIHIYTCSCNSGTVYGTR